MSKNRGFALAVFLLLMPVLAMMAWTFLRVGTVSRAQALQQEREIRALHAAEAGIRSYLFSGQLESFELNECEVRVTVTEAKVISTATARGSRRAFQIILHIEKGFVTERMSNEED